MSKKEIKMPGGTGALETRARHTILALEKEAWNVENSTSWSVSDIIETAVCDAELEATYGADSETVRVSREWQDRHDELGPVVKSPVYEVAMKRCREFYQHVPEGYDMGLAGFILHEKAMESGLKRLREELHFAVFSRTEKERS